MRIKVFLALLLFAVSIRVQAQYKTYVLSFGGQYPSSTNILVDAGTAVEGIKVFQNGLSGSNSQVEVLVPEAPGSTNFVSVGKMQVNDVIVGPALISIKMDMKPVNTTNGWYTLRFMKQSDSFTPSTAVVIPADAKGPVSVLMESSTNLVDWIGATPGTYGSSSQQRFFRVRTVQE